VAQTLARGVVRYLFAILLATSVPGAFAADLDWKKLTLFIGTTTGGGNDAYARLLARHIGRHLPGNPAVTPINRPGAGGLTLVNQMFATGAADGSEIATVAAGFAIDRVLYGDSSNARFEPTALHWLGSLNKDSSVFVIRTAANVALSDVLAGKPLVVGAPGPGGPPWFYSRALNALMGAKMQIISGYPGMAEVMLAVENGEIDGIAGVTWDTLKTTKARWFSSGEAKVILQYGASRNADLPETPAFGEITRDQAARDVMTFLAERDALSRPFFAPPGVSAERVDALRRAFEETARDSAFIEDARRSSLALDIVSGAEAQAIIARISAPTLALTTKLRDIFRE
jgi:tripartite-type tricarboxylate transporter receptor subunit TctC